MFFKKFNSVFRLFLLFIFFSNSSVLISQNNESKKYEIFSLFDYNNNKYSLEDFTDKRGIIVMFVSTQCPVSNAYNSRMSELYEEFDSEFSFLGINSNRNEDMDIIKKHAIQNGLEFIILKDSNNIIADKFEASFTPEVFLLNNELEQLYHGRIDDSRREEKVDSKDLRNALIEIIGGREVSVKKTKAFGCEIKRNK